jgi:hypothetical protein
MSDQTSSASTAVVASGTTGSLCQRTGPYVFNNGYIDIVVVVKKGDPFPSAPTAKAPSSGEKTQSQTTDATWSMVSDSPSTTSAI